MSGPGTFLYLGAGVGAPVLGRDDNGGERSLRVLDCAMLAGGTAEALQALTRSPRPDGGTNGFPSVHSATLFAVATRESEFHPSQAPLWYAGALLISESRVQLRRHTWGQVIAGALLGFGIAKLEAREPRGLLVSPVARTSNPLLFSFSGKF